MWFTLFAHLNFFTIILLNVGVAGFYYVFKYNDGQSIKVEIQQLEEQQKTVQTKVDELNNNLKRLTTMKEVMQEMEEEVQSIMSLIPNTLTSGMMMNHLTTNAQAAGVKLETTTNTHTPQKTEFYEKIKTQVTVSGLFSQILFFLSKLTGLKEMITVESFTLKKLGKQSEREVEINMSIHGYRYITASQKKQGNK